MILVNTLKSVREARMILGLDPNKIDITFDKSRGEYMCYIPFNGIELHIGDEVRPEMALLRDRKAQ